MSAGLDEVDLYAGAGGWDEAARILGLRSVGLEIEHDPCVTAVRAGHARIRCDVSAYPTEPFIGRVAGVIASPPCQAWSMAGNRLGELDKGRVHALVDAYAGGVDTPGDGWADPRSHHAAQPVRWIRDLRPDWVALEQVPQVIDLWRHVGLILRAWGYDVVTGVLNAADYGVPQTRQRAILIASRVRSVALPEPTHERDPRPALFGALQPWISMADALGWRGAIDRKTNSKDGSGSMYPTVPVPTDRPAPTLTSKSGGQWKLLPEGSDQPARTICGDRSPRWAHPQGNSYATGRTVEATVSTIEGALLQSFPADYPWHGNKTSTFLQVANAVPPRLATAIIGAATGADWRAAVSAHYQPSEVAA